MLQNGSNEKDQKVPNPRDQLSTKIYGVTLFFLSFFSVLLLLAN
jgi:hypothetical protein